MSKEDANAYIEAHAQELPADDRARFSESVSQNLLSLHEGNFARYPVSPNAFRAWQTH